MIDRRIHLPPPNQETFFLWGPRQTGKSTLLRATYPDAFWIDLLKADEYRRYLDRPELLREELATFSHPPFVVIDEIQKLPHLLDEVHWLHENRQARFALCGSSARKVRRGSANLLGGRAIRYELMGFVSSELGSNWDLLTMLNHGYLPGILCAGSPRKLLQSYVSDYLREEIAAEGLVRNLPDFSNFLNLAALSDTEPINYSTIARDCGVSSQGVKGYFHILEDTLMGRWLPAYRKRSKRRLIKAPKFYFSDVGVVAHLARRGKIEPGSELFGKAFENWCHHELNAYNSYSDAFAVLSYWRPAGGWEVDFVVNDMELAIEVKATQRIHADHLKGLRALKEDNPNVGPRIVVCLESKPRRTEDGIDILPYRRFTELLWNGALF